VALDGLRDALRLGMLPSDPPNTSSCVTNAGKALARKNQRIDTRELKKSRTLSQLNQAVGKPETGGQSIDFDQPYGESIPVDM
jgi:hypothetical protein